jgi:hypothetical protein
MNNARYGGNPMKHLILFLMACLIISGIAFAQETATPQELIIGKWKNANNMVYEFTADKKILVNEKEYATFRFLEGILVLTYMDADADFVTGLEFEGVDRMSLIEYKDLGDREISMLFKRQE